MDVLDAPAAFVAAILLLGFIGVSRRMDREETARGKANLSTNLAFWAFLLTAAYGVFFHLDHPFWGDVIASFVAGLIFLGLSVLAGAALRHLRGEQSQK